MEWAPLHTTEQCAFNIGSYAILILNRNLELGPKYFKELWERAVFRSTVDGGTDVFFSYVKQCNLQVNPQFPNAVSGDFDSITASTLEFCRQNGILVVETPDQNYTDFQKALSVIHQHCPEKLDSILVIASCSGRIDQTLSVLNTLNHSDRHFGENPPKMYLVSNESLVWYLSPGSHRIEIPKYLKEGRKRWCAILPFENFKNSVTTSGLKWNLDKQCIEFGGLISSSNTYDETSSCVTIDTNGGLLWAMEYC